MIPPRTNQNEKDELNSDDESSASYRPPFARKRSSSDLSVTRHPDNENEKVENNNQTIEKKEVSSKAAAKIGIEDECYRNYSFSICIFFLTFSFC